MGTAWFEREELIEQTARWLGFRRTGPVIRDTLKSVINGAIRRGLLEYDGPRSPTGALAAEAATNKGKRKKRSARSKSHTAQLADRYRHSGRARAKVKAFSRAGA